MKSNHFFRLLFAIAAGVLLATCICLSILVSNASKGFHIKQTRIDLEARAHLIKYQLRPYLAKQAYPELQRLCAELGKSSGMRITVIKENGHVVVDSFHDPSKMENHLTPNRTEILTAVARKTGWRIRYSSTLKKDMVYVAIPVLHELEELYVLRVSLPLSALEENLSTLYKEIFLGMIILLIVFGTLTYFLSKRIYQPMQEIKRGAAVIASGQWDQRIDVKGPADLAELSSALNFMADSFVAQIELVKTQEKHLEAILGSMVEGILAVDTDDQITNVNSTFSAIFNLADEGYVGRPFYEALRNPDVLKFVQDALLCKSSIERDIVVAGESELFLKFTGAAIINSQGQKLGAVIVVNNVTRERQLEGIRRDFVGNVSHELKTPLTAIKGWVETLQDGAVNSKEDAKQFLQTISKHVDRLNAIINDLLTLAKLDQYGEVENFIPMDDTSVSLVLKSAIETCRTIHPDANAEISFTCPEGCSIKANHSLLEQALVNLISNGIRYSVDQASINVEVVTEDNLLSIAVSDTGPGIPQNHLPRLFERFYRVDKARSRQGGGTGLGLAIVKHIAIVHGGRVHVESVVGQGSVFKIQLPFFST